MRCWYPRRVKWIPGSVALVCLLLAGCGSDIKDLNSKVDGKEVVLQGRVKNGPVGPAVTVSGWAGAGNIRADVKAGDGSFEARIPFYELPPGKLKLHVEAKEYEGASKVLAAADVEVEVPEHGEIGVVSCGATADDKAVPPNALPPNPADLSTGERPVVTGPSIGKSEGLACPIADGSIELTIRARPGVVLTQGTEKATTDGNGQAKLRVSITDWLGTAPLAAFAVKLDPTTGATTWPSAKAAVMKPLQIPIAVSIQGKQHQTVLTVGERLEKPVDPSDERAVERRAREFFGFANAYLQAARAGKVKPSDRVKANTAALLVPGNTIDLKSPLLSTNLYYFGQAESLLDVERFAIAKEGASTRIEDCGPYREIDTGLGAPGSPVTIHRLRVDMDVNAWTQAGKVIPKGVVEGGDGCPGSTVIKDFAPAEDYRDTPPTHAVGAWILRQEL